MRKLPFDDELWAAAGELLVVLPRGLGVAAPWCPETLAGLWWWWWNELDRPLVDSASESVTRRRSVLLWLPRRPE